MLNFLILFLGTDYTDLTVALCNHNHNIKNRVIPCNPCLKNNITSGDEKVKFYTALYHSMLAPTIYGDVDGAYYGPDKQVHQADGWTNYSTFSLCGYCQHRLLSWST